MGFPALSLVVLVALLGPLLALPPRWHLPVVLGELAAGIVIGTTGFSLVDSTDTTFTFLADIGFALIMFVAGSHVPVGDQRIRSALGQGALRVALTAAISAALGLAIAAIAGLSHAPLYAVLIASSSAALVLPIIESLHLGGPKVLTTMAQVAIADTAAIVALPLAIDPANAGRAALGALLVAVCAAALFVALRRFDRMGVRARVHRLSEQRKFALELRVQLVILFALAALATLSHVSIMLAGFSFGLAVAAVGEPRRLARQLFALTEGFLGPLFFVWLGASLNLRELGVHPTMILLGLALGAAAIVAHLVSRFLGQPLPLGMLAAAQLGVPVAAATIGTQEKLLAPGEASALILGALLTIGASVLAGARAAKSFQSAPSEPGNQLPGPAPS
ncbi:cation:proton antiporter [Psychromicrobium xiongbiense]|uniref:cation:proton antiporter n=1 Tax=Psychromicrobium xiongbiense TaxID=3051184 RepID=UPI0025544F6E|nr:cation:proton antiporter [Psychromicrobium sp. YIM S02556]